MSALLLISVVPAFPQEDESIPAAPDRRADEGEGPFERLIIRGAMLVDGSGAPPQGPVDIVIEGNRIRQIRSLGHPRSEVKPENRPQNATREIDARGMWVLPGFVDLHGHIGASGTETAEYVFKLWLAHGITTIRDPGCGNGVEWTLRARERSARNEIVAPRIFAYCVPGSGWEEPIGTPEQGREYARWASKKGIDGFKLFSWGPMADPAIFGALVDEARKQGLGTTAHLAQTGVAQLNALDAARLGLRSMEHWYGLPESLFTDRSVQHYPFDYNYNNEQDRFREAGRLWKQAAAPGSEKWNAVMDELLALDFVIDPTFNIYDANRDLMRARRAEWHDLYTLPGVWKFYQPSRESHGSYWFDWTTADEIAWKENYRLWMRFVNEYKNRGGRVCTGSDSGFIYQLFGFGYIRELELLQEAGFHPLEVIRSATLCGAEVLHEPKGKKLEIGLVRPGFLADLLLVEANPVANLKVLYGTGTIRLDEETGAVERIGGVRFVVKDGILYDAKRLLADVQKIVSAAKEEPPAAP
ncbi:MAG TPA: amidohydrolase [Thermoanaerobaculia bacterium]|nr:amidohydrolase [Thermoanaerobaculia bacterium]